ncbi:type I glyceraldehyde-3-phosphate dehydrogenase [Oligoflexaceae bacterium]|nr:type I glyceraldehyde-3-phosphate dehydrogenase [Oligoflexaceae bacterium]
MTLKVGINGFGRIGRVVTRAILETKDVEIVHINDLTDAKTLAHLAKYDSVHGTLKHDVRCEDGHLILGKQKISVSAIRSPNEIPWGDKGADIVLECTGIFRKKEDAMQHIKAGAKKVLISAPAVNEDLTVVYGVNHDKLKAEHKIVSNGSCTTNCLAPVAKVLHETFGGIEHALMTTIHAYTNDQSILDLPHSDLRRARAAAMSMIPTSTGAAKAIGLVIPELQGKFNGMAVRVPTSNVSIVDLTVKLGKTATKEDINAALKKASEGNLKGVLGYSDEPLVSIDYNGCPASSTVDALSTDVIGGNMVKVLSWYDNETGFSNRMIDVARLMAKL